MTKNQTLKVSNVYFDLSLAAPDDDAVFTTVVAKALGVKASSVTRVVLLKASVDARKKPHLRMVGTFAVELPEGTAFRPQKGVKVSSYTAPEPLSLPHLSLGPEKSRPVVVGTGPAGLFAALYLAKAGLKPLVLERGADVDHRLKQIQVFNDGGPLDLNTNVQFGEGGAGTFSDGKLNTGIKSPHLRTVLETFVEAGAPREILWQAKPHVGTDNLARVVKNLRIQIQELGGEVRFLSEVQEFNFKDGHIVSLTVKDHENQSHYELEADCVILATGHSARSVYHRLAEAGFDLEPKPFAVGVRIEHPQWMINQSQYGVKRPPKPLKAADYKLAVKTAEGRGVYSFCMCPGGEVVAASSELEGLCVNGMSRFAREGENANSALLVSVTPDDLDPNNLFCGMELQRSLERIAYQRGFEHTGKPYTAPVSTVGDYLSDKSGSRSTLLDPSYPRTIAWLNLRQCFPSWIGDSLAEALPLFGRKIKDFDHPEAVLTGVETRSSAPVRIKRGDDLQAHSKSSSGSGLFPCGEGAGYAGGIMSAAVDGLRCAQAALKLYESS